MSNKSDGGTISKSCSGYKTLDNSWTYLCPKVDINYSSFNNGVNCLCPGDLSERSAFDQAIITGNIQKLIGNSQANLNGNTKMGWK